MMEACVYIMSGAYFTFNSLEILMDKDHITYGSEREYFWPQNGQKSKIVKEQENSNF